MNFTEAQLSTLTNALMVAAERFDENATTIRGSDAPGAFITLEGAVILAGMFRQQAADTRALLELILGNEDWMTVEDFLNDVACGALILGEDGSAYQIVDGTELLGELGSVDEIDPRATHIAWYNK